MQTGLPATARTTATVVREAPKRQPARRFRQMLSALLLSLACMLSSPIAASTADATLVEEQIITAETSYPSANAQLGRQAAANATSAADLSLFGILALGIIGLLWVRRHTSEL